MNILVVGAGGREHAICWAIRKSTKCKNLYCAPGNAGIGEVATCVNIGITDTEKIVTFSNWIFREVDRLRFPEWQPEMDLIREKIWRIFQRNYAESR